MWHTALHHWWDWQTAGSFLLEKREPLWISTSFWLITPPTGVTASASSASCSAAPLLHPADSIAPITYRPLFYQSYHCHATSFNTESASFIPVATTRRHQHQIPLLRIRLEITTCLTNDRSSMSPVINILFYFILFFYFLFFYFAILSFLFWLYKLWQKLPEANSIWRCRPIEDLFSILGDPVVPVSSHVARNSIRWS